MRRTLSTVADALLWGTALVGILAVAASVVMVVAGARPVVVRSGSMEPAIEAGAVAIVKEVRADSVKVGDVLALERPTGERVMHRVVERRTTGASVVVVTKGDANETVDAEPVVIRDAYREVGSIAGLGRVATLLRSPLAGFALAFALLGPLAMRRRAPSATTLGSSAEAPQAA